MAASYLPTFTSSFPINYYRLCFSTPTHHFLPPYRRCLSDTCLSLPTPSVKFSLSSPCLHSRRSFNSSTSSSLSVVVTDRYQREPSPSFSSILLSSASSQADLSTDNDTSSYTPVMRRTPPPSRHPSGNSSTTNDTTRDNSASTARLQAPPLPPPQSTVSPTTSPRLLRSKGQAPNLQASIDALHKVEPHSTGLVCWPAITRTPGGRLRLLGGIVCRR